MNLTLFAMATLLIPALAQAEALTTLPKCNAIVVTGNSTKTKVLTLQDSKLASDGDVLHTTTDYAIGATIGKIHFEIQENPSGIFPEISESNSGKVHTSALALDWNRRESPEIGYLDIRTSIDNSNGRKSTVILFCERTF